MKVIGVPNSNCAELSTHHVGILVLSSGVTVNHSRLLAVALYL
jgi:hypothetical protein